MLHQLTSTFQPVPPADAPPAIAHVGAGHADAALIALSTRLDATKAAYLLAEREYKGDESKKADDHLTRLFYATDKVVREIEVLPATTLAGLKVKARALSWCHSDEVIDEQSFAFSGERAATDLRLAAGIVRDLLAIGAADARPSLLRS